MILENKLNITDQAELAREEERISKLRAKEMFETVIVDTADIAYDLCEKTTEFKVMRLGKRCLRIHKESFDQWLNRQVELS